MARRIMPEETFETLRSEVTYTIGRLEDEVLSAPLAATAAEWEPWIHEVERAFRGLRGEESRLDAAREGAGLALDGAVVAFGDDLFRAVSKDRTSPRWRAFFRDLSVTAFNRLPVAEQAKTVGGWLAESQDAVVAQHRTALQDAGARVDRAAARERALAVRRGDLWQAREALAARLTAARDALRDGLAALGREHNLPRGWADSFFRTGRRGAGEGGGDAATTTPDVPSAGG